MMKGFIDAVEWNLWKYLLSYNQVLINISNRRRFFVTLKAEAVRDIERSTSISTKFSVSVLAVTHLLDNGSRP